MGVNLFSFKLISAFHFRFQFIARQTCVTNSSANCKGRKKEACSEMSTLKFWNKGNSETNDSKTEAKNAKNGQRNWLHAPDALVNGHVAYLVKFLGSTPVEQSKGIEVVKEAIRRLQFTQQIKKAEGGNNVKLKKVEITISIDGVAIQVFFFSSPNHHHYTLSCDYH